MEITRKGSVYYASVDEIWHAFEAALEALPQDFKQRQGIVHFKTNAGDWHEMPILFGALATHWCQKLGRVRCSYIEWIGDGDMRLRLNRDDIPERQPVAA